MHLLRTIPTVGVLLLFLWGGALAPVVHLSSHVQGAPALADYAAVDDEASAAPVVCPICEGLVFWVDDAPETVETTLVYGELSLHAPDPALLSSTVLRSSSRAPPTTA